MNETDYRTDDLLAHATDIELRVLRVLLVRSDGSGDVFRHLRETFVDDCRNLPLDCAHVDNERSTSHVDSDVLMSDKLDQCAMRSGCY